ncbi:MULTISPECIES: response regulator transcription factor [Shewanella]|jgi:two-component system response regulator TtrR|uniref:Two component transcriptional regulator, LuxR family n=2 Tax=Shewanella putrefaciens TaxID=24 RepID=A4Y2T3_SHEPC|nr:MULTISPECIES: response regulator [Shewanella]CAD6366806.1 Tetrathionate response regulatory protein TtrR [Shewanella hafniensis]AVV84075.1 response regulator receiver protein [Shewanella putrefaciens]MCA1897318.1 response regulator [Shewanella putrefaciens]MCK7630828.1 response regulator [Shewanella sp. JNE9-1]MCK7635426.1 response regulator [Shewanella sp. JNE17]
MLTKLPLYLVDDDDAILDSLGFMLRQFGYQVQTFNNGRDFLEQCPLSEAGCVILDSRMPEITGQEVQQKLIETHSPLGVIFLTGHGDLPMALSAFRKGACDFFQKPVSGKALVQAIEKAQCESLATFEKQSLQHKFDQLTEREQQVLAHVIQGMTNKQISEAMFLSLRTIEVHRAKIMKKLEVNNMAELVQHLGNLNSVL